MPPSALGSQNGAVGRSGQDLPLLRVALGVLCWLCAPCRALGSPNFLPPLQLFCHRVSDMHLTGQSLLLLMFCSSGSRWVSWIALLSPALLCEGNGCSVHACSVHGLQRGAGCACGATAVQQPCRMGRPCLVRGVPQLCSALPRAVPCRAAGPCCPAPRAGALTPPAGCRAPCCPTHVSKHL